MLVALGGFGLTTGGAKIKIHFYVRLLNIRRLNILLIVINSSMLNSFPLMGSTPFSWMYFSITRFSKIAPEEGETTGCSGTSLETKNYKVRYWYKMTKLSKIMN